MSNERGSKKNNLKDGALECKQKAKKEKKRRKYKFEITKIEGKTGRET